MALQNKEYWFSNEPYQRRPIDTVVPESEFAYEL